MPYVTNGGWHLTYFGGIKKIKEKLQSIVEGIEGMQLSESEIQRRMLSGIDLYGRTGEWFVNDFLSLEEIDIPNIEMLVKRYPEYYLEHSVYKEII